jgi:hypothetical protein
MRGNLLSLTTSHIIRDCHAICKQIARNDGKRTIAQRTDIHKIKNMSNETIREVFKSVAPFANIGLQMAATICVFALLG